MTCSSFLSKTFFVVLLGLAFSSSVFAGEKPIHPYLYRIRIDGFTSWMLGTAHIPVKIEEFDDSLTRALESSQTIFIEGEVGHEHRGQPQDAFKEPQVFFQPTSLRHEMSPGAWARFAKYNKRIGAPDFHLILGKKMYLRPGFEISFIEDAIEEALVGAWAAENPELPGILQKANILDLEIATKARRLGIPVEELDSKLYRLRVKVKHFSGQDFSVYVMQNLKSDGSLNVLRSQLEHPPTYVFDDLRQTYAQGEVDPELHNTAIDRFPGTARAAEERAYLELYYRHKDWAKTLVNRIRTGQVFIAVGLFHVIEPESGLIKIFRDLGAEVVPAKDLFGDPSSCGALLSGK